MQKKANTMKKKLSLILVISLLLSLAGCGMSRPVTQEEINAIDMGTIAAGVYENAHFGIGCSLDEAWKVSPSEEIMAINKWDAEKDQREQMMDSLAKPGYFYEMMAETEDQSATVNVCVENVAVLEDPDSTGEDYVRAAVVTAREALSTIGVKGAKVEQVEQELAGTPCFGYYVSFENEGRMLHQKVVYLHSGIYAAVITVSCTGEDITDDLLDLFYQV